jgi:hypothetical protein
MVHMQDNQDNRLCSNWQVPGRYHFRVVAGLILAISAATIAGYVAIAGMSVPADAVFGGNDVQPFALGKLAGLGPLTAAALLLAMGAILLAVRPARAETGMYSLLAMLVIAVSGLVLPAMVLAYWAGWSPLRFLSQ